MPISRPYKRNARIFVDDKRIEVGKSGYILHEKYAQFPGHYIRAYLLIQKDLQELFDYIEPADKNQDTYSYRVHALLLRTCVEIEANFKAILRENKYTKCHEGDDFLTMNDYRKINTTHRLSSYEVKLPVWNGAHNIRKPFFKWGNNTLDETSAKLKELPGEIQFPDSIKGKIRYDNDKQRLFFKGVMEKVERDELLKLSSKVPYNKAVRILFARHPDWYSAYNETKHDRHSEFENATFECLIDAVCGLVSLLTSQFLNNDFSPSGDVFGAGGPNDGMESAIGGYFRVKYPTDWDEDEKYKFDWQDIEKDEEPFNLIDYDKIS